MRFVITGEMSRNRLLQTIVVLYVAWVVVLWLTNALLWFERMSLTPASVVEYYLGSEERFLPARSYAGLLEVSHFHFFAVGMLLMVLTHLMLFVPLSNRAKWWGIVLPFFGALLDEGSGWGVRFVSPLFAWTKIAGFLGLQLGLAGLMAASLWAVFAGNAAAYTSGEEPPPPD